jgi:hypothetical protein
MRNRFIDPAGVKDDYDWLVNHTEEEDAGKTRTITRTAPTSNVGLVKQQGEEGPSILRFSGTILDRSQFRAFWEWYMLCNTQTIHFRDFDEQVYEVQITSFVPKRVRKLLSPQRDASLPNHYWTYTMEMEVYSYVDGDLKDLGVAP